jgi:F-type H+-transporting ATPase subunit b
MKRWMTGAFGILSSWVMPLVALATDSAEGDLAAHGGLTFADLLPSLVNFVLLISLFIWLFRDAVTKALQGRRAAVEQALTEAARLKAEAEAKHREYAGRLAKLDEELAQIRSDMIAAGMKERDRIVAEAEHKAARMRKEADFLIEQQVKQLRADLVRDTVGSAVAAAERLLLKSATSFDQQRLAQEYLASLDQSSRSPTGASRAPRQESRV